MMMPNYGRKYIAMSSDVKLYLSILWTSLQKFGWTQPGAKLDSTEALIQTL